MVGLLRERPREEHRMAYRLFPDFAGPARWADFRLNSLRHRRIGPLPGRRRVGLRLASSCIETGLKKPAPAPASDWEVHPTTPWNYGLRVGADGPLTLKVVERAVGPVPFGRENPPVEIEVTGRRVPEWQIEEGSAGTLPLSPVGKPR